MKTKNQHANTPDGAPGSRQTISSRIYFAAAIVIVILFIAFAQKGHAGPLPDGKDAGSKHSPPAPPPVQFAVISDPHLYDTRLGTTGSAFESYLNQDPKLLRQSEAILESALDSIIQQHVRFVIIPGARVSVVNCRQTHSRGFWPKCSRQMRRVNKSSPSCITASIPTRWRNHNCSRSIW